MALVVTSRTVPLAARHRALPLRWLALATTLWSAGAFTFEQVALVLLPTAILDDLLQAERTLTLLLTATLCGAVWLNRRDDALLLFTATLAPLIFAARLLAEQVLVLLDLPTLAEVTSVGLGLVVLGLLTAATVATRMRRRQAARAEVAAVMFRWVLGVTGFVVFTSALSGASVRATGAKPRCFGNAPRLSFRVYRNESAHQNQKMTLRPN